jgi:site-specific DNA recombinase
MQTSTQFTNTTPYILPDEFDGKPIHSVVAETALVEYCLYARKSSEDDERQALSIDSQIKEMAIQGQSQGLRVAEIRKESHSAKESGQRPVFDHIIADIRSGLFTGILSWAPDRLSRNAGDLGTLVDLMDQGKLIEIRTHGQVFTNSPNDKFLLMILCSQAKLENDNRGINVKRGMKTKCELGFRPNMTPQGYLNDHYSGKGQKKVFVDKTRAPIIKQAFEKVAAGASGRDIYDWMKLVGFKTRSGKYLTLSGVYRMLNNPYYCGIFEFPIGSGKWYKGAYTPIITKELFAAVQQKMVVAPKSKPGTKQFDYIKLLKCGRCGSGITAQDKIKHCKNGIIKRYIYYHCTQGRDFYCPEPYIREEKLTDAFLNLLEKITIKEVESQEALKIELDKFRRLSSAVMGYGDNLDQPEVSLNNFARYILVEGKREEKRALISCLKETIYLKNKEIIVSSTELEPTNYLRK